jgi:glycine/D-amino acid oxidase-like deaminating enzyme
MDRYRACSLWFDELPGELTPRDALHGPIDVDVAIVGAGFTGLWTAYYLAKADPHLRIAVIEKEIAGFGASGRNGGWVSPAFSVPPAKVAKRYGRSAALALQRAMLATIDEVGRVAEAEGIDAHFAKGGYLCVSTSAAQSDRLRRYVEEQHAWGIAAQDYVWLDAAQAAARIRAAGCRGGAYAPTYACVQPARLARGLADVVTRLGVSIYERTPAVDVRAGLVPTPAGRVKADVVVRATEAYTADLPGQRRTMMPLYSHMIATAPLPAAFWDEVGWRQREVFNDGRHLILYAQRTADDRIAIGGTRAPYHFGSRIEERFDLDERIFAALQVELRRLFPMLGDAPVTHRWGGPLGATRDWHSAVHFDRRTGLAWAGGYVGDGVATANLAGRTLADLIVRRDSELVGLPWVGHETRPWEPEPLRWLATEGVERLLGRLDRAESSGDRRPRWAPLVERLQEVFGW